jgi:Protein of unknown function (DUF3604)
MLNRALARGHAAAAIGMGLVVLLLAACSDRPPAASRTIGEGRGAPWQRTEDREACADFDLLRRPYFGDLHVHTRFSADAYIFGTRVGPREAYAFARGEPIALADDDERQSRSARIDRPLDFSAVTDHAEFFGEVDLCSTPDSPVYDVRLCRELRQAEHPDDRFPIIVDWLFPAGIPNPPRSHGFCDTPGVDCDAAAVSVWGEMQAAAEEAYDRTAACGFTSFVGYEHTASPIGRHLHRNIIFRNDRVPRFAASQLETYALGSPRGVWAAVESDCLDAGTGCDAVIIPHNSNLSGGEQFEDPVDAADAQRRQDREPLVEIHQIKGNSECRFDRLAGAGVGGEDELCAFEQLPWAHEGPDNTPYPSIAEYPRRNLVREVLKDGLALEDTLGVNPFRMGFVGSTDTHDATAGNVAEDGWEGGQGNSDSSPARQISREIRTNPGGLAAIWAEENSRDALFDALRRRETYATSGPRMVVRFFAGALAGVGCASPDLARLAYATGVPMGGEIGDALGSASPRFVVLAAKDPGTLERPGADLERIQIVKGWVEASGETRERVYDVAGNAASGPAVDPATCAPIGEGHRELCAEWEDPEFDASRRAFYYVRVLERPTCRWSTLVCKEAGVDPFSADCRSQAAVAGDAFADCCLTRETDSSIEPTVRERAWTSPIWYRPDALADVDGALDLGDRPGRDALRLSLAFGRLPRDLDLARVDLSIRVFDGDEIWAATIPAGTLRSGARPGAFEPAGAPVVPGLLDTAALEVAADGSAVLRLEASAVDLSRAERIDHMVSVSVVAGSYRSSHTRLWRATEDGLAAPRT